MLIPGKSSQHVSQNKTTLQRTLHQVWMFPALMITPCVVTSAYCPKLCFLSGSKYPRSLYFVKTPLLQGIVVAVFAEISHRSPRKISFYSSKNTHFLDQSIQKINNFILKKNSSAGDPASEMKVYVLCMLPCSYKCKLPRCFFVRSHHPKMKFVSPWHSIAAGDPSSEVGVPVLPRDALCQGSPRRPAASHRFC